MTTATTTTHGAAAEHHEHPPFLAHHFDTPKQQLDTAKLGMWIFLVTEVLFFAGLFCFYAVYRSNHPEIFLYAHKYLDTNLGALNTCVLLFSSLTAAWSVRCAQLNQRKGLVALLIVTFLCGATFMGVKYVEYSHKFHEGLLWGENFNPTHPPAAGGHGEAEGADAGHAPAEAPRNTQVFFSIYFSMTGLHGLHVLIGMGLFVWLTIRAARGDFNPEYYGAVENTALYWHLVDLIWIYLFPLLYLIH